MVYYFLDKGGESMFKQARNALLLTLVYLLVANLGNLYFGVAREFSWSTTLWEGFFFFGFIFFIQFFRKKK